LGGFVVNEYSYGDTASLCSVLRDKIKQDDGYYGDDGRRRLKAGIDPPGLHV
jgi:hypothetical protein